MTFPVPIRGDNVDIWLNQLWDDAWYTTVLQFIDILPMRPPWSRNRFGLLLLYVERSLHYIDATIGYLSGASSTSAFSEYSGQPYSCVIPDWFRFQISGVTNTLSDLDLTTGTCSW